MAGLEVQLPNLQRVVRFPLRALLALTTAVALVAAAAGPVFRGVTLEGVARILVAWMAPLGMTAFLYTRHLKDASRLHCGMTVRFVVLHCVCHGGWRRWFLPSQGGALILAWVGASSYLAALAFEGINAALHLSVWQGIAMAWLVFSISRRPLFLCEEGIPLKRKLIVPWHWIRSVDAVEGRPNVIRLRRWTSDIYIEAPDEQ